MTRKSKLVNKKTQNNLKDKLDSAKDVILKFLNKLVEFLKFLFEKIKGFILSKKINVGSIIKNVYVIIFLLLIPMVIIFIHLYIAKFSVLTCDDLTHYLQIIGMDEYKEGNLFATSVNYAIFDIYRLGGRYFTMFMQSFFGIRNGINYLTQEKNFMFYQTIIYFVSIYAFIFSVIKNVLQKINIKTIIITLLVAGTFITLFNGFYYYYEPFSWFSAATSYSVPLSLLLLSFSFYICDKQNFVTIILCAILSCLALGGNVAIVVISTIFLFGIFTYKILCHKISICHIVLAVHYLIFSFINVMSPGNFERRDLTTDIKFTLVETFDFAMTYMNSRFTQIWNRNYFWFILILLSMIIAFLMAKNIKITLPYMVSSIIFLLIPIFVSFIIASGYGKNYIDENNVVDLFDRVCFIIDFTIIANLLNVFIAGFIVIYNILSIVNKNKVGSAIYFVCAIIIVGIFISNPKYDKSLKNIHTFEILDDINDKKYEKYYNQYLSMIEELEKARDKEQVTIHMPKGQIKHFFNFMPLHQEEFYNIKHIQFVEAK